MAFQDQIILTCSFTAAGGTYISMEFFAKKYSKNSIFSFISYFSTIYNCSIIM